MSKELTEQWRNGTLPRGYYYFSNGCEVYPVEHRQIEPCLCANGITVLDKVPSYEEYQALLSDSLAKNEGVEIIAELESKLSVISEQLKDANDIVMFYANTDRMTEEEKQMTAEKYHLIYGLKANDYLKKYGVEK